MTPREEVTEVVCERCGGSGVRMVEGWKVACVYCPHTGWPSRGVLDVGEEDELTSDA